jgi:hypothetical protein
LAEHGELKEVRLPFVEAHGMMKADRRLKRLVLLILVFAHVLDLVPIAAVAVAAAAAAAMVVFVSARLGTAGAATAVGFLSLVADFPIIASWAPLALAVLLVCDRAFVGEKLC